MFTKIKIHNYSKERVAFFCNFNLNQTKMISFKTKIKYINFIFWIFKLSDIYVMWNLLAPNPGFYVNGFFILSFLFRTTIVILLNDSMKYEYQNIAKCFPLLSPFKNEPFVFLFIIYGLSPYFSVPILSLIISSAKMKNKNTKRLF